MLPQGIKVTTDTTIDIATMDIRTVAKQLCIILTGIMSIAILVPIAGILYTNSVEGAALSIRVLVFPYSCLSLYRTQFVGNLFFLALHLLPLVMAVIWHKTPATSLQFNATEREVTGSYGQQQRSVPFDSIHFTQESTPTKVGTSNVTVTITSQCRETKPILLGQFSCTSRAEAQKSIDYLYRFMMD